MSGGAGDDIYIVDNTSDTTSESAGSGLDRVNSSVTRTLASNIELLFLTGNTAINGTGNTLSNLLRGNTGNNPRAGGGGNDILEGGDGADTLSNTAGKNLFNAGAGSDMLTGNAGNELFIFEGLVSAFDVARAATPGLSTWALTNALVAQHLSGSDTAALGGDLAYRYGRQHPLRHPLSRRHWASWRRAVLAHRRRR